MKSRSLVNAMCLIGQPLLLNAISLPAMAYIIRTLGPTPYGQWMAATSLVTTLFVIANPGLRILFVRRIAQAPDRAAEALGEQIGLRSILSVVAAVAALLVCLALRYPAVVVTCVLVTAAGMGVFTVANAFGDVLQGFERFRSTAAVNMIAGTLLTFVSVIGAWRGVGAVGMSLVYLIGPIVSLILMFALVHFRLFRVTVVFGLARYVQLLREVKMIGLRHFLATVQERIEQLVLPNMLGMAAFGYFSAGTMPASRLVAFPDGLATAYYPRISSSIVEDRKKAGLQVGQLMMLSLVVCVPIAVLLVFLAGPLASILFPKSAAICRNIIQITIWSIPLQGIAFPLTYSLQAAGKHSEAARAGMWSTIVGFVLSFVLISRLGMVGACWSWVLRPALLILFLAPGYALVFPGVILRLPVTRISCCALLMSVFLWGMMNVRMPVLTLALVGSFTSVLLYGAALVLTQVIETSQIRQLIRR